MTRINQNIATDPTSPFMSGDSRVIQATIQGPTGDPYNITGATITWALYAWTGSAFTGNALVTKTVGSGIAITNGAGGIFEVTLAPADSSALAGTYYHEAQLTLGGVVHTVFTGTITITSDAITA